MTSNVSRIAKSLGAALFGLLLWSAPTRADDITVDTLTVDEAYALDDPLHGYCGSSYTGSSCKDNGTITPFSPADIAAGFGFASDPKSLTGSSWLIAVLVPTTIAGSASETFAVSETAGAGNTAKTVSASLSGLWTSGDLAAFLHLGSSTPANKFGAFAVGVDAGVTGFNVYVANLGAAALFNQPNSSIPKAPLLTLSGSSIARGMEITAFLASTSGKAVATAPSSVLQSTGTTTVPEPATLLLFAAGLAACGAGRFRLRRPRHAEVAA